MKRFLLLGLTLALAPWLALAQAAAQGFVLSNGMTLIVKPDRRAPTAVHMLWVRVGSMDEVVAWERMSTGLQREIQVSSVCLYDTHGLRPGEGAALAREHDGLAPDLEVAPIATFLPVDRFLSELQRSGVEEVAANPSLEGMHQVAPHLFHCDNEFAFMMVPPPPRVDDRPMVLQLVFRPIARREIATLETVPQPSLVHAPGVR